MNSPSSNRTVSRGEFIVSPLGSVRSSGVSIRTAKSSLEAASTMVLPQQVALRCRIVMASAAGESDSAIARRLSINRNTVILWRQRFGEEGLDAWGRGLRLKFGFESRVPYRRSSVPRRGRFHVILFEKA
jgi:hypothetical protein